MEHAEANLLDLVHRNAIQGLLTTQYLRDSIPGYDFSYNLHTYLST